MSEPLLVAIVGPTGSGKTALSLALAERFSGEIVSCDSVAVYREMDIGTAKPNAEERSRIPHHLLDVVSITEFMTAGDYARRARAALEEIKGRGNIPIVVGGTGLYLRALIEGLFPGPERSEAMRNRLRQRARHRGSQHLHRILTKLDRGAAGKIHPNDAPKLIRAIEVCLASRQAMTELWKQGRGRLTGFRVLRIGLNPPREKLYTRLNQRAAHMLDCGLVEETARLLTAFGEVPPLNSTGYRQAQQLLRGELTREQTISALQQAHRNYAKRQMTWFRREPDVYWISRFGDEPEAQAEAGEVIRKALDG